MMSKKYLTYPEVQKLVAEAIVETRYETVTFFGKQAVVCGMLLKVTEDAPPEPTVCLPIRVIVVTAIIIFAFR